MIYLQHPIFFFASKNEQGFVPCCRTGILYPARNIEQVKKQRLDRNAVQNNQKILSKQHACSQTFRDRFRNCFLSLKIISFPAESFDFNLKNFRIPPKASYKDKFLTYYMDFLTKVYVIQNDKQKMEVCSNFKGCYPTYFDAVTDYRPKV